MDDLQKIRKQDAVKVNGRWRDDGIINPPSSYNEQNVRVIPFFHKETVGSGDVDELQTITTRSGVVDGTNLVALIEAEITMNGHTGATGTDGAPVVKAYREATADGNAATTDEVDGTNLDAKMIMANPDQEWSVHPLKMCFDTEGTYQICGYIAYYTP